MTRTKSTAYEGDTHHGQDERSRRDIVAEPPHYQQFEVPRPGGADEALVDVLAVGLHPRVRSGAAGAHYTSTGTLPMIPGIDAVGRRADGKRIYFVAADDVIGTMADKAVASPRRSIELPDDADAAKVAAAMNPAMSSWVALRRRVPIQPGQSVLVLGATGNAGAMAVQVARRLGRRAGGRRRTRSRPGPTRSPKPQAAPTTSFSSPATARPQTARSPPRPPNPTSSWTTSGASPPSRRSSRCSPHGQTAAARWTGSRSARSPVPRSSCRRSPALGELPPPGQRPGRRLSPGLPGRAALLVDEINQGTIAVTANTTPLAQVEQIWTRPDVPGQRTVLVP